MNLTNRQTAILRGAYRDLQANQTLEPREGFDRHERARQRVALLDAQNSTVPINVGEWLGREISTSESSMNSRAYKQLEAKGLIERINFNGERMTTHLRLTEAGAKLAKELSAEPAAN